MIDDANSKIRHPFRAPDQFDLRRYIIGSSNSHAVARALQWAQGTGSPLLAIGGGPGAGSSHLLVAAARAVYPDEKTWHYGVAECFRRPGPWPADDDLLAGRLLIIDSAGYFLEKMETQVRLIELLDRLLASGVRIGLSGDVPRFAQQPLGLWWQLMLRLRREAAARGEPSRVTPGMEYLPIPPPDARLVGKIFRATVADRNCEGGVIRVEAKVDDWLAKAFVRNRCVRLIQGLADLVDASARLEGADSITVAYVKRVIKHAEAKRRTELAQDPGWLQRAQKRAGGAGYFAGICQVDEEAFQASAAWSDPDVAPCA